MAGLTSSNQGAHEVYGGIALTTPGGDSVIDDATDSVRVNIVAGAGSGGTAATDDSPFAVGAGAGTPAMGLANDVAPDSVDEGDVGVVRMTLTRALHVNLRDSSGNEVSGGGASATDDAAFTVGAGFGTPIMGLADETLPDAVDEGDVGVMRMTLQRALHVNLRDATGAEITALSGGTSATDDAPFVPTVGLGTPIMGLADETLPDLVDEGDVGVVRMTLPRALHVNLRDSAGNEVVSLGGGGTQYAEDTPSAAGQIVTMAGVVRSDTAASLVDTDGDRTQLQVDATGLLRVNASGAPVPVTDGGGSLTVDGTVTATDGGGSLTVDDGGLSLTVDNSTLAVVGGGVEAAALRVTIATDSSGVLSIDDNGGSLTVDGVVTVQDGGGAISVDDNGGSLTVDGTVAATQSGTWTVQPGNTANTTPWLTTIAQGGNSAVVSAGGALRVDGSATTQPVSGTVTANQGAAPWSSNTTQLGGAAISTGAGNSGTGTQRVVIATDQPQLTNALKVDGSAVVQPVSMRTALTPSAPATVTIGTASATVIASNGNRKGLVLVNTGTSRMSLNFVAGTAVIDSGVTLWPGDSFTMDGFTFTTNQINGVASAAGGTLGVQEFA